MSLYPPPGAPFPRKVQPPQSARARKRAQKRWDEMEWTQHQFDPDLDPVDGDEIDESEAEFLHQIIKE
jgi:hypothetical protein